MLGPLITRLYRRNNLEVEPRPLLLRGALRPRPSRQSLPAVRPIELGPAAAAAAALLYQNYIYSQKRRAVDSEAGLRVQNEDRNSTGCVVRFEREPMSSFATGYLATVGATLYRFMGRGKVGGPAAVPMRWRGDVCSLLIPLFAWAMRIPHCSGTLRVIRASNLFLGSAGPSSPSRDGLGWRGLSANR